MGSEKSKIKVPNEKTYLLQHWKCNGTTTTVQPQQLNIKK